MQFDVDGARKAGYSETEIADHLAGAARFDAAAARKAGYSDAEIIAHVRAPVKSFEQGPSDRDKLLSSKPMRLVKGMKDPIDGLAQLASRSTVGADKVNAAADAVGGFLNRNVFNTPFMNRLMGLPENAKEDFAGEVLGIRGAKPEQLDAEVKASEAEYQAARKATAPRTLSSLVTGDHDPGFDAMRFTGNVVSPVNAALGRVLPSPVRAGAGPGVTALRGAGVGAAGAAAQPVLEDDFWTGKVTQALVGAGAGAVLTPVVAAVGKEVARVVDRVRSGRNVSTLTPEAMRAQVRTALQAEGIDVAGVPDVVYQRLAADAQQAVSRGRRLDPAAALRAADFEAVGVPFTRGQVTRDPAQWQKEFNLAGIEEAGAPLRNVLTAQARGVGARFQRGAQGAAEPFEAGETLVRQLQGANRVAEGNVRAAYKAFRESTGREMQVPMQGLAQDYAATLQDFGETIPGAVRKQFESLGIMSGTQRKMLSVEDAERLIKVINKNYNPADKAASNALNELRGSLQRAITSAADGDGAGAEAAHLAREARGAAAARFRTIDETPALRAAIDNVEPDDFVKKFVIGGKVNEIQRMQDLLGPEGREQVRAQTVRYLQQKAFGANAAGDGKAAQAALNEELNRIGRRKLVALLGEEGANEMQRVGRVLAYITQVPAGATPNTSGTSQALLSAIEKTKGVARLPWVNEVVVKPLKGFADRQSVANALQNTLTTRAELDPATVDALSRFMAPVPLIGGAAAGSPVR